MEYYLRSGFYIVSLLLCMVVGFWKASRLDRAGKILVAYIVVSLLTESLALYSAKEFKNNLTVYSIDMIIEFMLVMVYFNETVLILKERHIGVFLAIGGATFGVVNNFFMQPPGSIVNNFLTLNALVTIVLSLFSLTDIIVLQPYHKILRGSRFWVNLVFLLYSTITYFLWTVMAYHRLNADKIPGILLIAVFVMNILSSLSLAVIFLNYPKKKMNAT